MVGMMIKKQELLNNYKWLEKYAWKVEEDAIIFKTALQDACDYIENVKNGAIPTFLDGIDSKFFINNARKKLIEMGEVFEEISSESSC